MQEQYALSALALHFLPVGLDTQAGVYRVVSDQGNTFLLKVTSRPFYEPRCLIPHYLKNQGIESVVAPLPTNDGGLWARLEEWTVTLFPFIDGETNWTGMTDAQWREVGSTFKRIHQTILPPGGFEFVHRETFDPTEYAQWIDAFEARTISLPNGGTPPERALRSCWRMHQPTIHTGVRRLQKLAEELQKQTLPLVICHADLHPANLIRDPASHVWVIDWDLVMLAPKERDFLFVGDPPSEGSVGAALPPFWQGYEPTAVDWVALTYYRYERVIQDLIACASNVFLRDDLAGETKAGAAHLFQEILADGGEMGTAFVTAAHLPRTFSPVL